MKSCSSGMNNSSDAGCSFAEIIKVEHLLYRERLKVVEDGSGGFGEIHEINQKLVVLYKLWKLSMFFNI